MFLLRSETSEPKGLPAYREYLLQNKDKFPPALFEWATSDWYYNFNDPRCPHDAWLESFTFKEHASGERDEIRKLGLEIKLLGAYHDLYLTFTYKNIKSYNLEANHLDNGHRDWMLDEYRLSENGLLIHEIEWVGSTKTARWWIECEDIALKIEAIK